MEKKILIVDDQLVMREVVGDYFQRLGFEIAKAGDGLSALELLKVGGFGVVISDIMIPELNGIDFAAQAKKLNPELIIILVTAYPSLYSAQQALRIGVNDYLTKPIDLEELRVSVETCLRLAEEKEAERIYR